MAADARRPLKSRSTAWARALATRLAASSVTPNQISVASIGFALLGGGLLLAEPGPVALMLVALTVQLRLLCNLLDGMVAIEGGKQSPLGALYNEVPDRIADTLFLVPLGYAAGAPVVGWLAALAAALTAYVRVLGGTLGQAQDFRGPQAKPQRMAVMTAACLIAAASPWWGPAREALWLAVVVIAAGSLLTCGTRLAAIARRLQEA